jgi:hypothetical protein
LSALQAVAAAVDAVHDSDVGTLPDAALCAELIELRRQIDRLEAAWLARVAVAHARGSAGHEGYVTTAAFLRHACHLSPGSARARVRTAAAVDERPLVRAAFDAGSISYPHAALVTETLDDLPPAVAADAEPVLVASACLHDPKRVAEVARRLRHVADPDGQADRDARHREQRWLDLSTSLHGMVMLSGLLDPESGAVVQTWLDAAAPPPDPGDERTAAQRRADALVDLARAGLDAGELPDTGGERPHVSVLVDLATLQSREGAAPAEMAWAGPVSGEAARRFACDASITRIVTATSAANALALPARYFAALPPQLRGPTQPLDVGRATRTIPPAIRRALVARDRGSSPGCDRPPPWTDAHHIVHWADVATLRYRIWCSCAVITTPSSITAAGRSAYATTATSNSPAPNEAAGAGVPSA